MAILPARSRTIALAAAVTVALFAPSSAAWAIAPPPVPAPEHTPSFAAWTTDLVPAAFPGDARAALVAAVGCALGDVSGDGVADLLVLVTDTASGIQRLQALAGPDFEQVIWQRVSDVEHLLQCAPDLDLDGTLDPILHTFGETTGTAAGAASDEATRQVQQVLAGASGAAMLGRVATDTVTGAAVPVAGAAAAAGQQAASTLLPAATGAAAFLQTEVTQGGLPLPLPGELPLPVPLPIDGVVATVSSTATLQVLDATGAVVTTISIDQAGVQPLAMATLTLTGALPDVAVLTNTLSPVQQAATGVPELALYTADGALAWSTQLPAATGLPILVPQAGDLNLDGVGDLIVTTVEDGVESAPSAAYHVVSGVDGSILFDSGAAVDGLMAALPLGQLPDGPALLQAASTGADAGTRLALTALDGAGEALWSVDVDALAEPVNVVLDEHTGDITGFTDLTGDAVPDVAVSVVSAGDLMLQAIDGATGQIVWDVTVPAAQYATAVAVDLGSAGLAEAQSTADATVAGVQGATTDATGIVADLHSGGMAAVLAVGTNATAATLTLLDPVTGNVAWLATAPVTAAGVPTLSVSVAGDVDDDGTQDLLVNAKYNSSADAEGALGDDRTRRQGQQTAAMGSGDSVTVVSGDSGTSLYSSSASPGSRDALQFAPTDGQGSSSDGSGGDEDKGAPAPAALGLLGLLVVVAVLRRQRA